jgi:nicotinamidase-related amidase
MANLFLVYEITTFDIHKIKIFGMKRNSLFLLFLFVAFTISLKADPPDTTGQPIKPALLVIDIQKAFLPMMSSDKDLAMEYINGLIDLFRKNGYPVIRIYHSSVEYGVTEGTDHFEFPETVKILPSDPKVIKTYGDGFNKTDLDKVIKDSGSNTLFLCGLSATGCVLATWIGAQNFDYKAFMVKDAIISPNSTSTDQIEQIFDAVSYE